MELTKESNIQSVSPHSQALSQLVELSWKATRGLVEETQAHVSSLIDRIS